MEQTALLVKPKSLSAKLTDYAQFSKLRLAGLVVFSAAMAFIMGSADAINWSKLILLIIGGFLTTASANGFNQVIERDLDRLMSRTALRPIPDHRMSIQEGWLLGILFGLTGIFILGWFINPACGFLGFLSILLYTSAYTPLKRKTPFAVFVGAIPGAIPPMLGWVAATGHFGVGAWLLFSIQFLWQFPHFWAIAWVLDDDYKKAGFKMLPTGERDKDAAFQALLYTLSLLPLGFMPYIFGLTGWISVVVITAVSLYFLWLAFQLFVRCDMEAAKRLMFGSFIYLPVVQVIMAIDKL